MSIRPGGNGFGFGPPSAGRRRDPAQGHVAERLQVVLGGRLLAGPAGVQPRRLADADQLDHPRPGQKERVRGQPAVGQPDRVGRVQAQRRLHHQSVPDARRRHRRRPVRRQAGRSATPARPPAGH